jgi:hypothetical protein
MNLEEFQAFVAQNLSSYAGVHPEAEQSFHRAERALGCRLPDTLKWLLGVHGYSTVCGIASLEDAVATTLLCRREFSLPPRYVVLNDWGDGGVVYLDSDTGVVAWGDGSDLYILAEGGVVPDGNQTYSDYPAWTIARKKDQEDEQAAEPGATDNPDDAQRLREDH